MSKGLNGLKIGNPNEGKKKRGKTGRIKMMGQRKKEMVIPQEGKIQMMIQPTHGIITIKSVKIRR